MLTPSLPRSMRPIRDVTGRPSKACATTPIWSTL